MGLKGEGISSILVENLVEKMESWESSESSSGTTKGIDPSGTTKDPASVSADSQRKPGANTVIQERPQNRRILIVEDDLSLAQFLCAELEARNYSVEQAHDGEHAIACLESKRKYDLLVLDLNLPKVDGLELLRQVRPVHMRLPILVLTARSRVEDKVTALHNGADDCLTKPFSLAELLARVNALLRRNSGMVPNCSSVGDLVMYREERRVERNSRKIELTPREFALLDVMMQNSGRPVSRASLLEEVWKSTESSTNIVDVYMKYVRDKIDLPGEPSLIHTVRGFGYELRID